MLNSPIFRNATINDLPLITEIYNESILNSTSTFDTEIKSLDEQKEWFCKHNLKYCILVSELNLSTHQLINLSTHQLSTHQLSTHQLSTHQPNNVHTRHCLVSAPHPPINFIIGWASLSRWSDRCAYQDTAELSIYIHKDYRNKGIGKELLKRIITEGEKHGIHTILSRITIENIQSIRMHESEGFILVGTLREVGRKFGKLLDVVILQKIFTNTN